MHYDTIVMIILLSFEYLTLHLTVLCKCP